MGIKIRRGSYVALLVLIAFVFLSSCSEKVSRLSSLNKEAAEYSVMDVNNNFAWCVSAGPGEGISSETLSAYVDTPKGKIEVCCAVRKMEDNSQDGLTVSMFCSDFNRTLTIIESYEGGETAKRQIMDGQCRINYEYGNEIFRRC